MDKQYTVCWNFHLASPTKLFSLDVFSFLCSKVSFDYSFSIDKERVQTYIKVFVSGVKRNRKEVWLEWLKNVAHLFALCNQIFQPQHETEIQILMASETFRILMPNS